MTPEQRSERLLLGFPPLLRGAGFAASPDRSIGFMEAVGLLGPGTLEDIHRAGLAIFAIPPERRPEYDAVFDAHFRGRILAPPSGEPDEEDELRMAEDQAGLPPGAEGEDEAGTQSTASERLGERVLEAQSARIARLGDLPRRPSRRRRAAKRGAPDLRRAAREAMRRDGDLLSLPRRKHRQVRRRILLLVDVSGSMAGMSADTMRFAHELVRAGREVECFTLGTRLTRITRALRQPVQSRALANAGALVADWDGGTRLGDGLSAFLSVPRFAGHARGALVCVISDGLERGDPASMASAIARLSRLSWRLIWLSPLCSGEGWQPQTAALKFAQPHIDHFGRAGSTATLTAEVTRLATTNQTPTPIYRDGGFR